MRSSRALWEDGDGSDSLVVCRRKSRQLTCSESSGLQLYDTCMNDRCDSVRSSDYQCKEKCRRNVEVWLYRVKLPVEMSSSEGHPKR
jgi:hypothetical protein